MGLPYVSQVYNKGIQSQGNEWFTWFMQQRRSENSTRIRDTILTYVKKPRDSRKLEPRNGPNSDSMQLISTASANNSLAADTPIGGGQGSGAE